jgi:hypothetical protein
LEPHHSGRAQRRAARPANERTSAWDRQCVSSRPGGRCPLNVVPIRVPRFEGVPRISVGPSMKLGPHHLCTPVPAVGLWWPASLLPSPVGPAPSPYLLVRGSVSGTRGRCAPTEGPGARRQRGTRSHHSASPEAHHPSRGGHRRPRGDARSGLTCRCARRPYRQPPPLLRTGRSPAERRNPEVFTRLGRERRC